MNGVCFFSKSLAAAKSATRVTAGASAMDPPDDSGTYGRAGPTRSIYPDLRVSGTSAVLPHGVESGRRRGALSPARSNEGTIVLSDVGIAQHAKIRPISWVAESAGIEPRFIEPYG